MGRRIAINQAHGPAGCKIHQGRMQQPFAYLGLELGGKRQMRQAFALPIGAGVQHPPARPELQMRLLG